MINILENFWKLITGRKMAEDIYQSDALIQKWLAIYAGTMPWSEYKYPTLGGTILTRRRKTMNAAKLICSELARLIWSELPEINTDENIEQLLKDNNFFKMLVKFSEYGIAGGGFALKLFSPDALKLKIDFVTPNYFIPVTWDNTRITEADFVDKKIIDNKSYVTLEKHRLADGGYNIDFECYEELDGKFKRDKSKESDTVFIKTSRPLFVYIANPEANNLNMFSPLGIAIYANAIDTLESLDIAFDALNQEIILGRKRIIVPASAVRTVTDTAHPNRLVRYFDPSDEIFQAFNQEDAQNIKITDNSVELRIDEIRLAIQTLLDIFCTQTGFSAGSFSFDGVSMKTATEVISENSKTFKLKQSYENNIGAGILELLESIREIGANYGLTISQNEYNITFNDAVIEDRNSKTDYWLKRYIAKTCTLENVLEELDGDTEDEAKAKAEQINNQNATVDINSIFGTKTE